jgi:hypothetical protein
MASKAVVGRRRRNGGNMRAMRVIRVLIPVLSFVLVFQGTVAALPHDHGGSAASAGEALVAPSAVEAHGGCLACSAHAPAAVAASSSSALDCADHRPVVTGGDGCDPVPAETSAFDPRGPPSVV